MDLSMGAPTTSGSSNVTDGTKRSLDKREKWSRKMDFLLASLGFCVGLGNIWRFPYLCYKNGGGAFLVPYLICMVAFAIPLAFLEAALGQFMSTGAIGAWNICPLFTGIGYASTVLIFLTNTYYIVILAWAFYYLFSSFTTKLPWDSCNNTWNTENCYDFSNSTGINPFMVPSNASNGSSSATSWNTSDPATEFWERHVLQLTPGIDTVNDINWKLASCLLLAWIVVYLCIWRGIKVSGKVMYFTAIVPYVLLLVLLVRGMTLPGALDGVTFYIVPEWSKLKELQVWVDAGTQIFFSYGVTLGVPVVMGSFNHWNHNCWRDSIVVCCVNSFTSIFAGFVVFSTLGFMAYERGVDVSLVAESGPGLAFVAYPKAIAKMPLACLWSVVFFLLIIVVGLDSEFLGVETFVTSIIDEFPKYLSGRRMRKIFIASVCCVHLLVGLSMVTNGGIYVFQLFDYYAAKKGGLLVAALECFVIVWIYGVNRFYENLSAMLGFRLNLYMKISWMCLTPAMTLIIFGMSVYTYSEVTYNRTYIYPTWAVVIGWMITCSSLVWIPLTIVVKLCLDSGTIMERLKKQTRPNFQGHAIHPSEVPPDPTMMSNTTNEETLSLNQHDSAHAIDRLMAEELADANL